MKIFEEAMPRQVSALLQITTLLSTEILNRHQLCQYLVHVTNATANVSGSSMSWIPSPSEASEDPQILLSASESRDNSGNGSTQCNLGGYSYIRFGPCFLFVHEIIIADGRPVNNWPQINTIGGSLYQNFHLFLVMNAGTKHSLRFAKSTRQLYHALHLQIAEDSQNMSIFKTSDSGITLNHILSCKTADLGKVCPYVGPMSDEKPNLERTNVHLLIFCGVSGCDKRTEEFRRTGRWFGLYLAPVNEIIQLVNGTMSLRNVLLPPTDDQDEITGEWDAWTQPLVDGSATISVVFRTSVEKSKVVYTTMPFAFDNVVFVTGKARKTGHARSWSKLSSPFTSQVWLCCLTSAMSLLLMMKCGLYLASATRGNGSGVTATAAQLAALLLKPIFAQPPMAFQKVTIGRDSLSRVLLGTWLVSLIILVCGYTSTMTSHIVLPLYEDLPSTFQELASSDFKLFGKYFHGNLEKFFESLNNSWGNTILSRVTDTNVFSTECLRAVLESRQACISLSVAFRLDDSGLLLDSYGRDACAISRDRRFFITAKFTVSKFHPSVFVTFNRMLSALTSTGVTGFWNTESLGRSLRIAKGRAKTNVSDRGAPATDNQTAFALLFELVVIGGSISIVIFIMETIASRLAALALIARFMKNKRYIA